jgi:hypothetical protein
MNANPTYFMVLCELYNPIIHGDDEYATGHFIVHSCYKHGYLFDNEEGAITTINYDTMKRDFFDEICHKWIQCKTHPFIRNYKNIVRNKKYFQPQIAMCYYLPHGHTVAIIKTFWISIIQRKWKKVYAQRKEMIIRAVQPGALRIREIRGVKLYLPGIQGLYYA